MGRIKHFGNMKYIDYWLGRTAEFTCLFMFVIAKILKKKIRKFLDVFSYSSLLRRRSLKIAW